MKKFLTGVLALMMGASIAFAQTPDAPKQDKPKAEAQKDGQKLKKDGTPDKRFKENKEGQAEGPKKKDGTPDKRFKENKDGSKPEGKPAADGKKPDGKKPEGKKPEDGKKPEAKKAA